MTNPGWRILPEKGNPHHSVDVVKMYKDLKDEKMTLETLNLTQQEL